MQSGPSSRRSSVDTSPDTSMSPKAIWNELRDRLSISHRRSSAWENARHECSDYFITTASDRAREQQLKQKEKDHKKAKCFEKVRRHSEQRSPLSISSSPEARRRFFSDWGTCFGRVQQSADKSPSVRSDRPLVSGSVSELERGSWSGSTSLRSLHPSPLTRPEVGKQQQLDTIGMKLYHPALPTCSTCHSREGTCEETSFEQTSTDSCATGSIDLRAVTMESSIVVDGPLEDVLEESEEVSQPRNAGAHRAKQVSLQVKLALEDR